MNKKANNYMIIIAVLLLVAVIIAGAGWCYLNWPNAVHSNGTSIDIVEKEESQQSAQETVISENDKLNAKEEGRQEVLDSIREDLEAGTSAEDILKELLNTEVTKESEQTTEEPKVEEELTSDVITMDQITISENGEYTYQKDGKVLSHKGIDVSKYQGEIDWKKVAVDGVEYAFVRVGCRGYGSSGKLLPDDYFHQNVKGALAQGIKVGAYFFSQALNIEEALEEAAFVLEQLKGYNITYPIAIDIEYVEGQTARQDSLTKEQRTEVCIAFCERIKEAGYIPMIYGDKESFSELLDAEKLVGYEFWFCNTEANMDFPYELAVWQYSHKGKVSGIQSEIDLNISFKEW